MPHPDGVSGDETLRLERVLARRPATSYRPQNTAHVLSFPPEVRLSAAALNLNIGTALIGSTTGLIAVWLHGLTHSDVTFGWYRTAACLVSILVTIFALPASANYGEPDWREAGLRTRVTA
jgi:MHS family proline/betaine transporter-like MFS transporter